MKTRFHNFYILKPSLVPFSLAFIMLGIVFNFVFFLNGANGVCESEFCFRPDIFYYILFLVTVVNWLFLNMSESTTRFSSEVTNSILVGFALFILSEIMLFFSFFWAFFYFSTAPSMELGSIWPPLGLQDSVVSTMNIPLANTIILLSSGVTLTLAQYASRLENKVGYFWSLFGMLITIVYAFYFISLQWLEYSSSSVDLATSIYGSVFYMLTGLHGSHVIVGTLGLSLCLCLLEVGYIGSDLKSTLYTCTIWYWHFVDVVWIFVFSFVYMWGNLSIYPSLGIFSEADFAESSMLGFQESVTYSMRTITALHNYVMFYLIGIFVVVCILLYGALTVLNRNIITFKYRTFRGQYIWKRGFFHKRLSRFLSRIEKRMWKRGFETNSVFTLSAWLFYLIRYFFLQNLTFYEAFWFFARTLVGKSLFYMGAKIFYLWSCSLLVLSRLQLFLMASIVYPYKLLLMDIYGFSSWKMVLRRGMYYNIWWPLVAEDAIVRLQWELRFFFSDDYMREVFWYSIPDAVDKIEHTAWGVLYYAYFEKHYMCLLNIPRSVRWTIKVAWINRLDRCLHAVWYLFTPFSVCKKQTQLLTDYYKSRSFKRFTHYASLEGLWSILPAVILGFLAVPSIIALYALDDANSFDDCLVVKVIGHQWYWTYEVSFLEDGLRYITFSIDSFMIAEEDLAIDGLRLLDVDYPLYLPVGVPIKLLVTSNDVIHSFTVPSFGIKVDAVPGRLNQVMFVIARSGDFWGQCSELCGVRHGFMPVHIVSYLLNSNITTNAYA